MATDYGTDVRAADDLPDPEALASGETNVAHAITRRLLQDPSANEDVGDEEPYACLDLRDYLGKRVLPTERRDLEAACERCIAEDPRVETVSVSISFSGGVLTAAVSGTGTEGPFDLVLSVDAVTGARLVVNRA